MTEEDFLNWDYCTELLASQESLHKPNTEICYHAKSIGFLVGELIKRVSGNSVGNFLKEELVDPLKLLCTIGTPIEQHKNIAELISSAIFLCCSIGVPIVHNNFNGSTSSSFKKLPTEFPDTRLISSPTKKPIDFA